MNGQEIYRFLEAFELNAMPVKLEATDAQLIENGANHAIKFNKMKLQRALKYPRN